ncbi:MAG: division/cell wall cluster transcriptional repressor MraZ [Deltaproteobacteria bacterium]|nr:division/cell wall cluster transcriptional repressor MraZ [Deltaproteobacteria bacterium]
MFRGLFEHSVDTKGRTSLPVRFREVLARMEREANGDGVKAREARLIVTTGIDRCLVAYPLPEWQAFETKLAALSQFDPAVVQLKRIYVAGASECTVDRHGRLLLPPMLREYAGLNRDLVWAGMVTTIEIWAKELWTEQSLSSRVNRDAIARALTEHGL